jgi:hypothetical protein
LDVFSLIFLLLPDDIDNEISVLDGSFWFPNGLYSHQSNFRVTIRNTKNSTPGMQTECML